MDETRRISARPVTTDRCGHGEGPVWDERDGVLRFVDMLRGDLMTYDPRDGGLTRTHVTDVLAALRPRRAGGWVLATERGFALTEPGSWTPRPLGDVFADPTIRMNEGGCDPGGDFLCGSMAYDQRPGAGSLYRLAADGRVTTVLTHVTISNGFCPDPAGRIAYYVDTPTRRIDVFDLGADGHELSGRRPFVTIEDGAGNPDGLAVDAEGAVWVALYRGAAVRRYLPDGRLDLVVDLPTPHVTSCAFGGEGDRDLFITTSQEHLDPTSDPWCGALFHAVPGPAGLSPLPYAG